MHAKYLLEFRAIIAIAHLKKNCTEKDTSRFHPVVLRKATAHQPTALQTNGHRSFTTMPPLRTEQLEVVWPATVKNLFKHPFILPELKIRTLVKVAFQPLDLCLFGVNHFDEIDEAACLTRAAAGTPEICGKSAICANRSDRLNKLQVLRLEQNPTLIVN